MNDVLKRCLDDLERRISPQEEERIGQEWIAFSDDRFRGDIFSPRRGEPSPPSVEWPFVSVNAALEDYDAMALQQFGQWCSQRLANAEGHLLSVRCNYGTSILPLLFGPEPFVMDEELNTLPTSRPLPDLDAIKKILARGVPDLHGAYGGRALEMGERYMAIASEYPKIGRHVHIYHPDLQGPMDVVELLWGSSLFYALYDTPALVKELLELVTATYVEFMRAWERVVPFRDGYNAQWGLLHKGRIMLRDDSAMNLSPEMFEEFVRPYDQKLLDEFGGGGIHFCGRGDHYIEMASQMSGLHAINMSEPGYNDMDVIFTHTVDKGIKIIGLERDAAEAALARGRALHGQVHCA